MQLGSESRMSVVAAAIKNREGDTVSKEGSDNGVITALHIRDTEHHGAQ